MLQRRVITAHQRRHAHTETGASVGSEKDPLTAVGGHHWTQIFALVDAECS
jgi:hypothetical protein